MLFHDAAGLTAAWENCNAGCNKMAGSAFGMLFDVTPPYAASRTRWTHMPISKHAMAVPTARSVA